MDFAPSPRLVEIQARARAFVESVLQPLEVVCDAGRRTPTGRRGPRPRRSSGERVLRAQHAGRVGRGGPGCPRAGDAGGGARQGDQLPLGDHVASGERAGPLHRDPAGALPPAVHPRRVPGLLRGDRAGGGLGHHPARHRGAAGRRRVRHLGREVVRHRRRRRPVLHGRRRRGGGGAATPDHLSGGSRRARLHRGPHPALHPQRRLQSPGAPARATSASGPRPSSAGSGSAWSSPRTGSATSG